MNTYDFGAPCASGSWARRARDRIRRDSYDRLQENANASYSTATNNNGTSPSYSQDYASIPQQSPWQKIATPPNRPPSRACSSCPQEQGSSQKGTTVDPELQAASHDPQRDRPTFGLGTTLKESSSVPNSYLSTPSIHETSTTDNSINNANNPDNRVNNGHIKIGNSSSRVSGTTMAFSNDIINIGTLQYHVWMPPGSHNPEPPSVDQGGRENRNRARERRGRSPRHEHRSSTTWGRLWCFY